MTTGETSPWAREAAAGPAPTDAVAHPTAYPTTHATTHATTHPVPHAPAYPATYDGPWRPAPAAAPPWGASPPWTGGPDVSDAQLRSLPPPLLPGAVAEQRPAVVGLAVTLAVTAALLWVCGLSLFLLVAAAGTSALGPAGEDGVLFHLLDDVLLRMGDGLWVPLYGFPVASLVTGFCLLARRPWTRIAHMAVGALALGWAAWWLQQSLLTWAVVAVYVGVAVAVLWVPSVGRWYAARPRRPRPVGNGTVLSG